jgi:hypothetical protein
MREGIGYWRVPCRKCHGLGTLIMEELPDVDPAKWTWRVPRGVRKRF